MKVRLDASRLLVYRGASRLEQAPDAALDASIAKLFVSEALVKSALDTIQILGGYGFMTDSEVERVLRNKKGATLEEMKQRPVVDFALLSVAQQELRRLSSE